MRRLPSACLWIVALFLAAACSQGKTGPEGVSGATGATGATGSAGSAAGATGAAGSPGATGPTGALGSTGTTGFAGATGLAGATGATGAAGHGGATGGTGAPGLTWGGPWQAGTSYQTGSVVQDQGSSWVVIVGPTSGTDEPATSTSGAWQLLAAGGTAGTTGPTGLLGTTGATGTNGTTGPAGAIGATGATGVTWVGMWQAGMSYVVGDAVLDQGASWVVVIGPTSIGDEPSGSTTGAWQLIAAGGTAGADGITGATGAMGATGATGATGAAGLSWAGPWTSGTSYQVGEVVEDQGSAYVVIAGPTLGADAPAGSSSGDWQLLSSGGGTGATGATGNTGTQGATGNTGATGSTGNAGSTGATGNAGNAGATGSTGATGATGNAGTTGTTGATGNAGATGSTGTLGSTGATGSAGATGATGPTGSDGSAGATGATGSLPITYATTATANTLVERDSTASIYAQNVSAAGTLYLPADPGVLLYEGTGSFLYDGSNSNLGVGDNAVSSNPTGSDNVGVGSNALANDSSGTFNTALGFAAQSNTTSGSKNVAVGSNALNAATTAGDNVAVGWAALANATGASFNTAIGFKAMNNFGGSGESNVAIGTNAGNNLSGGESNDIYLGSSGISGESGTIRIGDPSNQSVAYLAGVYGTSISGGSPVVVSSSGQLGTAASYAAEGVSTDTPDTLVARDGTGSFAADNVSLDGDLSLGGNIVASPISNQDVHLGTSVAPAETTGGNNTAAGWLACSADTTGANNTALGTYAMQQLTTSSNNTAIGTQALQNTVTGSYENTAVGYQALSWAGSAAQQTQNTAVGAHAMENFGNGNTGTGTGNLALGDGAGGNLQGPESNEILIGSAGAGNESGIIRIGTSGTQTAAYLAGVYGTSLSSGSPVLVTSTGQLGVGTTASYAAEGVSTDTPSTLVARDTTGSFAAYSVSLDGTLLFTQSAGAAAEMDGQQLIYADVNNNNVALGGLAMQSGSAASLSQSVAVGAHAMQNATDDLDDVAVGYSALLNDNSEGYNTALGAWALHQNTSGVYGVAVGMGALQDNISGRSNTALGYLALTRLQNGSGNVAIGESAGSLLTGSETENIYLKNDGVTGESDTIRIGTNGTHTAAYISGIYGTSLSGGSPVVISSTGQLGVGTTSSYAAEGVSTDTPSTLVARDNDGGFAADTLTLDGNLTFTANNSTSGAGQITIGGQQMLYLASSSGGEPSVYVGVGEAPALGSNQGNMIHGSVALGYDALQNWNAAGGNYGDMIAIGAQSGINNSDGQDDIYIGNSGANADESATIRIGTSQSAVFIAGIQGATLSGTPMVISSSGQLGVSSSGPLASGTNLLLGTSALGAVDGGVNNTALGYQATAADVTGSNNTSVGYAALESDLDGGNNTAIGAGALSGITTGNGNIALGVSAGNSLTGGASNNIEIGNTGASSDSETIRIGSSQTAAFIAGIYGNAITGGTAVVVDSSGQVGVAGTSSPVLQYVSTWSSSDAYATGDVVTYNGTAYVCVSSCSSGILPTSGLHWTALSLPSVGYNTATGTGAGALAAIDGGTDDTAFGQNALGQLTTGSDNTAMGYNALQVASEGSENTALGSEVMVNNSTGSANTAIGYRALLGARDAGSNTAIGVDALSVLTSGSGNIAIGNFAGSSLSGSESNNIDLDNVGTSGESGVMRLGSGGQTATYIAGIDGVTVSGGTEVYINDDGQLGTVNSSRRFKDDIHDIGDESRVLMSLRPVAFKYKPIYDASGEQQYGLIAEEVSEVAPQLVIFNGDGQPQTVKYNLVNALLLNEFQRHEREIVEQRSILDTQQQTIQQLSGQSASLLQRLDQSDARTGALESEVQAQQVALTQAQATVARQQQLLQDQAARLERQEQELAAVRTQLAEVASRLGR